VARLASAPDFSASTTAIPLIAATCETYNMDLISEDMTIGSLSGNWQCVW
jgi:hypothetical protein